MAGPPTLAQHDRMSVTSRLFSSGDDTGAPTLIITNDFPPAIGGIEGFVADLCELLSRNVVVLTRRSPGWRDHDQRLSYPVFRTTDLLLPTAAVTQRALELVGTYRITRVIYGALAPLALLAPRLRQAGAVWQLGISHGHEVWWASLPGARRLLRRMADSLDRISVISDYTRSRIEPVLSPGARGRMIQLPPPVDLSVAESAVSRSTVSGSLSGCVGGRSVAGRDPCGRMSAENIDPAAGDPSGPGGDMVRPRCIAAGRMVRQKGFDVLLDAWRSVLDAEWAITPELVLIGHGPCAASLRRQAARLRLGENIRFVGPVGRDRVGALLSTGTVFALPVRTRLGGLQPEGLGRTFLEAAANGLPVIAGRSGGAPETLIHPTTGFVVDPRDPCELAGRLTELLGDPARAARMGRAGRRFVAGHFGAVRSRSVLRDALGLESIHAGEVPASPSQASGPVG